MLIDKNSRFVLVGHGKILVELYNEIIKKGLKKPIIITHQKKYHLRDIRERKKYRSIYIDISELKKKTKIYYISNFKPNTVRPILKKHKIDYIFSCSSRFVFGKKIINIFKNKIFNIHGTLLPQYKAGSYTHRILNCDYHCGSTIHIVEEQIDSGKILLQTKKLNINKSSIPYDFLVETNKLNLDLIKKFVKNISLKKKFNLQDQNHEKSTYYPRFYTDVMGAINWDWNGIFIKQLISACAKPYSGAFCYIIFKNKKYKIKIFNSKFYKAKKLNHPALNGKIFFQNKKIIKVSVNDGYISINLNDIYFEKKIKIKRYVGKTFFNSQNDLEKAKIFIPNVFKYK